MFLRFGETPDCWNLLQQQLDPESADGRNLFPIQLVQRDSNAMGILVIIVIIMGKYEPKMYLFLLKYVEFNFLCDDSDFNSAGGLGGAILWGTGGAILPHKKGHAC